MNLLTGDGFAGGSLSGIHFVLLGRLREDRERHGLHVGR